MGYFGQRAGLSRPAAGGEFPGGMSSFWQPACAPARHCQDGCAGRRRAAAGPALASAACPVAVRHHPGGRLTHHTRAGLAERGLAFPCLFCLTSPPSGAPARYGAARAGSPPAHPPPPGRRIGAGSEYARAEEALGRQAHAHRQCVGQWAFKKALGSPCGCKSAGVSPGSKVLGYTPSAQGCNPLGDPAWMLQRVYNPLGHWGQLQKSAGVPIAARAPYATKKHSAALFPAYIHALACKSVTSVGKAPPRIELGLRERSQA
jgi:hypothetical protein